MGGTCLVAVITYGRGRMVEEDDRNMFNAKDVFRIIPYIYCTLMQFRNKIIEDVFSKIRWQIPKNDVVVLNYQSKKT